MAPPTVAQLARIARLRSYVATFARGGEYRAAAEGLLRLSRVEDASGLTTDALRRARQGAVLSRLDSPPVERVQALVHLGTALLDSGDADAAGEAAARAIEEASAIAETKAREALLGCGSLLAGIAARTRSDLAAARHHFDEARERLVVGGRPDGVAIALSELGLVDLAEGAPDRADVCFTFAREFHCQRGAIDEAAHVSAAAAESLFAAGYVEHAAHWGGLAVADADRVGDPRAAALLACARAECLEAAGALDEAASAAREAASRCDRAARDDLEVRAAHVRARLRIARLGAAADEALRHLEAAFDLALPGRDEPVLAEALERTVAGLVEARFPRAAWSRVDRFQRELQRAGLATLAAAAADALAELQ